MDAERGVTCSSKETEHSYTVLIMQRSGLGLQPSVCNITTCSVMRESETEKESEFVDRIAGF